MSKKLPSPFTHTQGDKDHQTISTHRQPSRSLAQEDSDLSLRVSFSYDHNHPYSPHLIDVLSHSIIPHFNTYIL